MTVRTGRIFSLLPSGMRERVTSLSLHLFTSSPVAPVERVDVLRSIAVAREPANVR